MNLYTLLRNFHQVRSSPVWWSERYWRESTAKTTWTSTTGLKYKIDLIILSKYRTPKSIIFTRVARSVWWKTTIPCQKIDRICLASSQGIELGWRRPWMAFKTRIDWFICRLKVKISFLKKLKRRNILKIRNST